MKKDYKKLLKFGSIGLLVTGVVATTIYVAPQYLNNSVQTVEAEKNETDKANIEGKKSQIMSGLILSDIRSNIKDGLEGDKTFTEKELDRLTYYLYKYAQSKYQYVGVIDSNKSDEKESASLSADSFIKLKDLYEKLGFKAPFEYNVVDGEVVFNRDVKKPEDYNKVIDKVEDVADEKAKSSDKDKGVSLESEGIIE